MTSRSVKYRFFKKFTIVISLLIFFSCATSRESQTLKTVAPSGTDSKETFHLYLLIGQSNMAGRGIVEEQDKKSHSRVLVLNKENNWVTGVDPIHFDKEIAGVGPGLSFGKDVADRNPNIRIGLIPCAAGGSPIGVWKNGEYWGQTKSKPYDEAVKRTKIAMADGKLKGILWHQGESDSVEDLVDEYKNNLIDLINSLRKDFVIDNLPFVSGELGEFNFHDRPGKEELREKINIALHSVSKEVKNSACVSAKGLTPMDDGVHFNASSERELGRRYAVVMSDLLDQTSNIP